MCGEQIFEEFQMLINILLTRVIECLDIIQETNMRMEKSEFRFSRVLHTIRVMLI